MRVLSLFDGISCGRAALDRLNAKVDKYYASEVDKYAIEVASSNWDDVEHVGDVTTWKEWNIDWSTIDLILAGSPCQGFSFAGKQLAFNDPRSRLFFVFVEILNHVRTVNPKVKFLLENVRMKQEFQDIISDMVGTQPVAINSALLSAQNRYRLYWCNWNVSHPNDKGLLLKDIIHENVDYHLSEKGVAYMLAGNKKWGQAGNCRLENYTMYSDSKSFCITSNIHKGVPYNCFYQKLNEYIVPFNDTLSMLDKEVEEGKMGYFRKDPQANRVYYINEKDVTSGGDSGGGAAKMGQYLFGTTKPDKKKVNDGRKFYTLTNKDKQGVLVEGYIRKLTPVECERLQTLPDNYTAGISDSQRYKCLGNGWTVDVIVHILSCNYKVKRNFNFNI